MCGTNPIALGVAQGLFVCEPSEILFIRHIAFGQKPLTRRERAEQVKKRDYFTKYGGTARKVLELLLDKYADAGITEIESMEVLKLKPFDQFGSVPQIIKEFGGKPQYLGAIRELEQSLYQ